MNRRFDPRFGSALLILALLAAPASATLAIAEAPASPEAADCRGGCCGEVADETSGADCCSDGLPGCPLPCCSGLACTVVRPAATLNPGEAAPSGIVIAQNRVPFVSPGPIDHPPRT